MTAMLTEELSLGRHLPDLSDASFQIPLATNYSVDYLLAEDDGDFFQGAEITLSTPAPSRINHAPLTLSQLTPKPHDQLITATPISQKSGVPPADPDIDLHHSNSRVTSDLRNEASDTFSHRLVVKPKPRTKVLPGKCTTEVSVGPSGTISRYENFEHQVNSLTSNASDRNEKNISSSTSARIHQRGDIPDEPVRVHNKLRHFNKRGPAASGISKAKQGNKKSPRSSLARNTAPARGNAVPVSRRTNDTQAGPRLRSAVNVRAELVDPNPSLSTSGGVAERIVVYSQKLINSIGLFNSEKPSAPLPARHRGSICATEDAKAGSPSHSPLARQEHTDDSALTLSQISPLNDHTQDKGPATMSPPRKPNKRPSSTVPPEPVRKKGRTPPTCASDSSSAVGSLPPSSHGNISAEAPMLARLPRARVKHVNRTLRTSANKAAGERKESAITHDLPTARRVRGGPQGELAESHNRADQVHRFGRPDATLPGASLTKPVEFNFQSDMRLEARRAESEKEKATSTWRKRAYATHPVPDFRAIHAAHEAELASRKVQIPAIVPLPIKLCTEERAKEREKFDEKIREKEREMERAAEKRRLELEEEEERQVREMRRKAVPKAHEVPEWYKEAPRRKGDHVGGVGVVGV